MEQDDDSPSTGTRPILDVLAAIGAGLGLVLIIFGLWALGGAIYFAWGLFREPGSIGYFAKYFLETTGIASHLSSGGEGLAHYVSWIAVVLLLLVLGKLGLWAVSAGAQLVALPRR